jgi:hypothetical protein
MCRNKNSKIYKWEEPSSNPHPRQLPNKFKMSKLGPKNLFKKTKKKKTTQHWIGRHLPMERLHTSFFGSLTLAFPDTF